MDITEKISMLEVKDTKEGNEILKDLECISKDSDVLYPYIDKFVEMLSSDRYVVRVPVQ